jgi:hypothetical protein
MTDDARKVAFDPRAPEDERQDAMGQLTRTYAPSATSLIPTPEIQVVIDHINQCLQDQADMVKAGGVVVPFPARGGKVPKQGMRSVMVDDLQATVMGEYIDKPNSFGLDALRDLVARTPLLSMICTTRVKQVSRFCQPSEDDGIGFAIVHEDKRKALEGDDAEAGRQLTKFFKNCGWEFNPRKRKKLRRDSFTQFMAKSVWDSLSLDASPIETEMKRGASMGMDGFYAPDGTTIRLCTEEGYNGDDEIFALQVIQGRVCTSYTHDQLVYEVRNPRADVRNAGYGTAEPELMVRVITGWLNAMSYNTAGFDQNAIPKGILHLSGAFGESDVVAFKRFWNQMVKGVNNAWALPVLISKDQESKASFEKLGVEFDEMYFSKWMTFLTSIACAIYSISPDEINFSSFSADKSSLSGSDTETKLAASKDKGLRPLLSYYEAMFTDYFVSEWSDHLCFRWVGLDEEDPKQKWEEDKTALTWGELRARRGDAALEDDELSNCPVNPSFIPVYMQKLQAAQQGQMQAQQAGPDYGDEGGEGEFGDPGNPEPEGGADDPATVAEAGGDAVDAGAPDQAAEALGGDSMGKALGSAVFRIGE